MTTKRIIHKLIINEISAVDRPAQKPARVAISKRDDGTPDAQSGSRLDELANALMVANPAVTRDAAMNYLLHSPSGRALFRLHKGERGLDMRASAARLLAEEQTTTLQKRRENPEMDKTEIIKSLARDFGAVRIAKHVIEHGNGPRGTTLSEADFTAVVTEKARAERLDGETVEKAFSRIFLADDEDGLVLRKAHAVIKELATVAAVQVGGKDALNSNSPSKALKQLQELAAEQRRRSPFLTTAQAFARVYQDPANAELTRQERLENRPAYG